MKLIAAIKKAIKCSVGAVRVVKFYKRARKSVIGIYIDERKQISVSSDSCDAARATIERAGPLLSTPPHVVAHKRLRKQILIKAKLR